MRHFLLVTLLVPLVTACDKNAAEPPGPPPAPVKAAPRGGQTDPHAPTGGGQTDPHAGLGVDPHAGMQMPAEEDPHGGMGDPNDPNKLLEGTIEVSPSLAAQVKQGDVIYMVVRKSDASGKQIGGPIAVDRLTVAAFPISFRLDGSKFMMEGTKFEGDVIVKARVDRDGEAKSAGPGDIEGQLRTTIPKTGLKLVLDTLIP